MAASSKGEELKVIPREESGSDKRGQSTAEKRAARNSRVHFGDFEDTDTSLLATYENKPLLVESVREEVHKTLSVYLGFLQEAHRYDVRFGIPFEEIKLYCNARDEKLAVLEEPSNSRLTKMVWENQDNVGKILLLSLELEVTDGITFEDKLTLHSESVLNRYIHINVVAQVLGKGQGTPALKYGIKCLGHCGSTSPADSPKEAAPPMDQSEEIPS